jgi:drug/metabolite transporter (DMT)-like permease
MEPKFSRTFGEVLLAATRWLLPVLIAVIGIVLIILGHGSTSPRAGGEALESGTGVGLIIVAMIVWMVNWLFRMSVTSNRDREQEEAARQFYDRHGYWPDEGSG